MAIGDFEDKRICYGNWYMLSSSETAFTTTDTWTDLNLEGLRADIENNIKFDTTNYRWTFTTTGFYVVQMRMAFAGGSNDSYSMRMQYNWGGTDYVVADSEIIFTTKATNTWEVQNLMILPLRERDINNKGFGRTDQKIIIQVKNNDDTSSLNLKNGDMNIYKIG